MKKILILLAFAFLTSTTFAQQQFTSASGVGGEVPKAVSLFDWTDTSFDFGKITLNKPVTHEFKFINKGTAPLLITNVQVSCGCTVAEYSKDPVPPGSTGFIRATFNAARVGFFKKTITISANTESDVVSLFVMGEVLE